MEYNTEAFSHIIDVEILATPASCTDVYIVKEIELNMGLYFCWGGGGGVFFVVIINIYVGSARFLRDVQTSNPYL